MKILSRFAAFALVVLTLTSAGSARQKPGNLVLFIGDGMGVSHVYAAMTVSDNTMTFPAFQVTGFSRTHSENSYSTDSAAGGTPAGFATHVPLRYGYRAIAKQYMNGAADIFTGHSGIMVPVFAFGPGASELTGIQENTDLFHDICKLLSLDNKRR